MVRQVVTRKLSNLFKSNGKIYAVTSYSGYPIRNSTVNTIAYATQTLLSGTINDNSQRVLLPEGYYSYVALDTFNAREGDSGGPVFLTPNADDEIEFAGIIMGTVSKNDVTYTGFVPWYKIRSDLGLQSSIP